jgi:hypothetical protein
MNILISSTVFPPANTASLIKSVYTPEDRLAQTKKAVEGLQQLGYKNIYLCDNSGTQYQEMIERELPGVIVKTYDHFQFENKGISESFLLLEGLKLINNDDPVIKISGRYGLRSSLDLDFTEYDFAAKFATHTNRKLSFKETMITRCYAIKNKDLFQQYLVELLEQIYSYPAKVYGPKSFVRLIRNQFSLSNTYSYLNANLSVEAASMGALKKMGLRIHKLESIGLYGYAGTFDNLLIED